MSKKQKKKKRKDSFLLFISEYMRDNYSWVAWAGSISIIIIINIFKFFEYLNALLYSSYFGLDIELLNLNDTTFVYRMILSLLILLASIALFYCFKQLKDNFKHRKFFNKENLVNCTLIIITNLCLNIIFGHNPISLTTPINIILYAIIEYLISIWIFKDINVTKENKDIRLGNYLKLIPFEILLLIISYLFSLFWDLQFVKEYRTIENDKVIISTNKDYYLVLECEIVEANNEITIYKGTQEKINNSDVKTNLRKFETIKVEEK